MPKVATVEGVKILFYPDEHPPPHFHAKIAKFTAQIRIEPVVILKGSLPPNKRALVLSWAANRKDELLQAWADSEAGKKPDNIT